MIDYKILDESVKYYEACGFTRIETPWTVSKAIDDITKPKDRINMQLKHNDKCLVASGEQSFLYQSLKGFLPKGKYQTITPCFRFEEFDETHTKYFMKNELIITDDVTGSELTKLVDTAMFFFRGRLPDCYIECTGNQQFDIKVNNIELGSYGIRRTSFLHWIYGTGCAEPRFSSTINGIELGLIK